MDIDPRHVDEVLATTYAVRRRLDLERPVDNQLLLDCIDLAEQAPTGGNLGSRRWVIVRDQAVKDQLGELYRQTALPFMSAAAERLRSTGHPQEQVMASARYLAEHLAEVPRSSSPIIPVATTAMAALACSTRSFRRRGASAWRCGRGPGHHVGHGRPRGRGEGEGDPRYPCP